MGAPTRPVLRYHGGKWRLAPWIISHFPAHRVYVEPFGGAASVLMRKPRTTVEVYNDLDGEVVNLFRVLRDARKAARLTRSLRLTPFARPEYQAAYRPARDAVEQARRTLVKAWMGFGSGALIEGTAGFRVALGSRRHTPREWASFAGHLGDFTARLAGVLIEHRPAALVIEQWDAGDALLFVDPPYVAATRGARHRYRCEFTDADHQGLAEQLRLAKGAVVVSGYDSPLYARLYTGWSQRARMSLDAASRLRREVLWLNPACAESLNQQSLNLGGVA